MGAILQTKIAFILIFFLILVFLSFYLVNRVIILEDALVNCQKRNEITLFNHLHSVHSEGGPDHLVADHLEHLDLHEDLLDPDDLAYLDSIEKMVKKANLDIKPPEPHPNKLNVEKNNNDHALSHFILEEFLRDHPGTPWKKAIKFSNIILQTIFDTSHPPEIHSGVNYTCNELLKERKTFLHGHARWLHNFKNMSEISNFSAIINDKWYTRDLEDSQFRVHSVLLPISKYKDVPYYTFLGDQRHCDSFKSTNNKQESYQAGCRTAITSEKTQCGVPNVNRENAFKKVESNEAKNWFVDTYDDYHQIHVITARRAIIFDGDLWSCDQELYSTTACGVETRLSQKAFERRARPKIQVPVVEKLFNLGGGPGYYHWIAESLIRLSPFLKEVREDKSWKFFVQNRNEYLFEWMELLGINRTRLLTIDPVAGKHVVSVESTICCCNRRIPTLMLREAAYENLPKLKPKDEQFILILVRSSRRWILNMKELIYTLQQNYPNEKMRILHDKSMPKLKEYATWFQNAKMVIGMFGAGLTNIVLCQEGTIIMEFGLFAKGNHYLQLALSLGLKYIGIDAGWESMIPPAKFLWGLNVIFGEPTQKFEVDPNIHNYKLKNGTIDEIFMTHYMWLSGLIQCTSVVRSPHYIHGYAHWFSKYIRIPSSYSNFTTENYEVTQALDLHIRIHKIFMPIKDIWRTMYLPTTSSKETCEKLIIDPEHVPCPNFFLNEETQCNSDFRKLNFQKKAETSHEKFSIHPDGGIESSEYEMHVLTARDVIVFDGDVWSCDHRYLAYESCGYRRRLKRKEIYRGSLEYSAIQKVNRVLVLSCDNSYGGFLTQCLPRLMPYLDEVLSNVDFKVVTSDGKSYVQQYLRWLGFPDEQLLIGRGVRAFEAFIPESSICGCTRGPPLILTSNELRKRILPSNDDPIDILILNAKRIRNIDEIIKKLQSTYPEFRISVQDIQEFIGIDDEEKLLKITQTFENLKLLISTTHVALSNMIFMPPGAAVFEIYYSYGANYLSMGSILGLQYHVYEAQDGVVDIFSVLGITDQLLV